MTYELYKPLRNHLRKYSLLQSLAIIRAYFQHLQFDQPFPNDIEVNSAFLEADSANKNVYEWELELLAREVIINSVDNGEYDMRRYPDFASAVNKLKRLENEIGGSSAYRGLFRENVLQELFRIAHRQFPWQKKPCTDDFMRYYRIFGRGGVNEILVRELGVDARQICSFGLALTGMYLEKFGIRHPIRVDMEELLKQHHVDLIIQRFSIALEDLQLEIVEAQSYDQDFAYTMNPLLIKPLVWVNQDGVKTLIAPVPTYVLRRFTEGIYYEIFDADGFSIAFGSSFQEYIGDVLAASARGGGDITVLPEAPYQVGRDQKHSIDWIVGDGTATLFLECKTKRVRYAGKLGLADTTSLDEDLGKMADFIVQAYKTLSDALAGRYTHWRPDDRPIYPMVVTLEEWYSFGDRLITEIDMLVRTKLQNAGLGESVMERYPYSICAAKDFEYSAFVMSKVGIGDYMLLKNDSEHRFWSHGSFTASCYGKEMAERPDLFPEAWQEIIPSH